MSTLPSTMKAAVIHTPGGPSAFQVEAVPVPTPKPGWVLIRTRAFGLNRSELFTRQGHSPSVKFPRILGIECVGTVASAPGHEAEFPIDQPVATYMGEMGREFDGGYAEYTCVPAKQVYKLSPTLQQKLGWETFGAMPEMLNTVYGSLVRSLALQKGESLLIRGGTTSIGLAAAAIAKHLGAGFIASTTRREANRALLENTGAVDEVIIDDSSSGPLASRLPAKAASGFDKVLELVGGAGLRDSLRCARQPGGVVCQTGIVSGTWTFDGFNPMEWIPSGVRLTVSTATQAIPLEELGQMVVDGKLKITVGKVFKLDEIVKAHELMDSNKAGGKIVVVT